jgi:hypothetical protein
MSPDKILLLRTLDILDRVRRPAYIPRLAFCFLQSTARWERGYPADCKSVYSGSNPLRASILENTDLEITESPARSESRRHARALAAGRRNGRR